MFLPHVELQLMIIFIINYSGNYFPSVVLVYKTVYLKLKVMS